MNRTIIRGIAVAASLVAAGLQVWILAVMPHQSVVNGAVWIVILAALAVLLAFRIRGAIALTFTVGGLLALPGMLLTVVAVSAVSLSFSQSASGAVAIVAANAVLGIVLVACAFGLARNLCDSSKSRQSGPHNSTRQTPLQ